MLLENIQSLKITNFYKRLINTIKKKHPDISEQELKQIQKAYELASLAHKDQKRLSGEHYIIHPLHVAIYLAEMSMDPQTIIAGLLHDVIEDTKYNEDYIKNEFGEEVAKLVKAVTKISLVKKDSYKENLPELKAQEAAENLRLMLLATVEDIRVIIIKLADKLHNMQTIQYQKPHKIERIAKEVLDIYAPIAGRLGMYKIKSELEDLAFESLCPEEAKKIKEEIKQSKAELEQFLKKVKKALHKRLEEMNIKAEIDSRVKHLYSVYTKMQKSGKTIKQIYDLRGIRIIVPEIKDCYAVLGVVHTLWKPLPGRFKDYIALPKPNGYQSLHTTVMAPDGKPLEIQIRTYEMNERAENGIAAHWLYKHNLDFKTVKNKLEWLQTLKQLTQEFQNYAKNRLENTAEFLNTLKEELQPDEIYVFTPKADIITLPKGATVLDFAFKIHTDLGLRCKSALVNDRIVPLSTELKSGDKVEIITHPEPKPSPIWIKYVKSTRARQKIRAYFRRKEELEPSKEEKKEVAEKKVELKIKRKPSKNPKEVPIEVIGGGIDVPVRYAGCCSPVPGDKIIGYITRGRGITIHRVDCSQLPKNQNEIERFISVKWEGLTEIYPVAIEITARDRQGLYLDLVQAITNTKTNILKAVADLPKEKNGIMKATFLVEIEHIDQLNEVIQSLQLVKDVIEAKRKN
ncbi:MAG: GTP pyrophosphokinase [Leptospiraceae bacterium]|nr:MAG: GTP pyrophosphokinase [Leptospiraceae bacterium]